VAREVQEAKTKYESIDKEKLKEEKCISIASEIKFFKEECFYLRSQLAQAKKQLKAITTENDILEYEQRMLQKTLGAKSKEKDRLQRQTLHEFFKSRDKEQTWTLGK
jgi:regulator of replication initiation timing